FRQGRVDAAGEAQIIMVAVCRLDIAAEVEGRPARDDADHARRRVAPAQRALRSAQHLDPLDLAQLVEADARTRAIHAVDEHRDRAFEAGVVAHRTDAANARRAIGFGAGRG